MRPELKPEVAAGTARINLSLMMRNHAANEAKAIRRDIAKREREVQELRLELENLIKHASIEGVSLDEPAPASKPELVAE